LKINKLNKVPVALEALAVLKGIRVPLTFRNVKRLPSRLISGCSKTTPVMSKASPRPSLPTSSTDFALPPSSTSSNGASGSAPGEESHTLMHRFRRPSLLAPKASYLSDNRHQSPLSAAFTMPTRRRRPRQGRWDESSESDKDRMWTDSSPSSSENPTPPLRGPSEGEDVENGRKDLLDRLSTPPRNSSASNMDSEEGQSRLQSNRITLPVCSIAISRATVC